MNIDKIISSGLFLGGHITWDSGAATGQFTSYLLKAMRERMWKTHFSPIRTMLVPLDTYLAELHDDRKSILFNMEFRSISRIGEARYLAHGGILPKDRRLVIGLGDSEEQVIFGCF